MKNFLNISISLLIITLTTLTSNHGYTKEPPSAQSTNEHYVSHRLTKDTLIVTTTLGDLHFSALTNHAIEVLFHSKDQLTPNKIPASHLPSYALKAGINKQSFNVVSTKEKLLVSAGVLHAEIIKKPFAVKYFNNEQLLTSHQHGFFKSTVHEQDKQAPTPVHGVRFTITDKEQFIGAGQRVVGMNRKGHRFPLYNRAHYGYETHSNQMNYSLPAVISSNKYLILFDNTAKGWLDIGKTDKQTLQFEAVAGRNAYIIIAGDNYPQLINNYVDVTGKQPMPPRWALGNFASRFGYRTEQEVNDTVSKFNELDIPLDAVIIDLYWFGKDIQGHMGNLNWDREHFPTPTQMMSNLNKQGVKPIIITEPFILSSSTRWEDAVNNQVLAKDNQGKAKTFDFYFGNTGIVDVFNAQGRNWFNNIYHQLDKQGVKGWWGDLGEPEVHPSDALHTLDDGSIVSADAIHNVYGHQWAKMVFDNMKTLHPNQRSFILMRAGFAGSQRYGMIPWTGDVSRSWGGLKPQVELSLQMSMLGLAYTHSDLGGFAGGEVFDKELYIRWLQYGVFQPIYRPHGQDHIPSEVVFHDTQTQDILRKFIKLRYQLLPYHYTMAYQNSTTGMPLMRPLFFDDNHNPSFNQTQSYYWGDAFLVRPIINPNIKTITMDFPKGTWFDYFSGQRYQGGQTHRIATSIATLPVFVKAGAFIPMISPINTTDNYSSKALTLHYYADKTVSTSYGQMYEDDGISANAINNNAYELLSFNAQQNKQQLNITLTRKAHQYQGMPEQRNISLVVHNWQQKPNRILINNKSIEDFDWNKKLNTLTVTFNWQKQPLTVKIN